VRRRYQEDAGYLLQTADRRVVFVLPFADDFTLIGTTDENFVGDVAAPMPSGKEILYLCDTVNEYFRDRLTPDEPVWAFAGVRALHDDGSTRARDVTRDYALTFDESYRMAPVLTVYGGKITTHRRLAEEALARIAHFFQMRPPWTATSTLPGGDFPVGGFHDQVAAVRARWPFLSEPQARRLTRAYGTRVENVLKDAQSMDDLGTRVAGDLTAAEVRYLIENEWAQNADDVLWRRSKQGLYASENERNALAEFIASLRAVERRVVT
jgi:glycerol-3-phosphate dehydrogenase